MAELAYKQLREHIEKEKPMGTIPAIMLPENRDFAVNIDMLRKIDFPTEAIKRVCEHKNTKVLRIWANKPLS
ncbi:MAG: hypothetical protein QG632_303 [Candidatus Dependentiae bacterium]|nr:hypothetical protein [Candidatus Dependentiae bacterium]